MSIERAIKDFMDSVNTMKDALEVLRTTVKQQGSVAIQEQISRENFEFADSILESLKEFTQMEFESNAEEILEYASGIIQLETVPAVKKAKVQSYNSSTTTKIQTRERESLNEKELSLIETIGLTGLSRTKDATEELVEELIEELEEKGYLSLETIRWNEESFYLFELTEKGKQEFKSRFGMEANESFKSEMKKKNSSLTKGLYLYDIENALQTREFKIHKMNDNQIEISKNNVHYYLTPDMGQFRERDYYEILNKKNQLKSIGFICVDKNHMEKTKEIVQKWVSENEKKCKFLSIHLTTIDDIENNVNIFDSLVY